MTVCSFTPSRIGIITSRRSWSKASVTGEKVFRNLALRGERLPDRREPERRRTPTASDAASPYNSPPFQRSVASRSGGSNQVALRRECCLNLGTWGAMSSVRFPPVADVGLPTGGSKSSRQGSAHCPRS